LAHTGSGWRLFIKSNTQPYLSNRGWYGLFLNKEVFGTVMENYIYNMFELAIGKNRLSKNWVK
jgi:hypothetical protein